MPSKPVKLLSRLDVPDPSRVVAAAGRDRSAVWRERDGIHNVSVSLINPDFFPRRQVPESGCPVRPPVRTLWPSGENTAVVISRDALAPRRWRISQVSESQIWTR